MAVIINGSEIILSGMVGGAASGDGWFDPPGFASGDVIQALATVGTDSPVRIRLNSGGGIATEGAAIHSAISMHKGAVEIVVEGIAASAASLVAMAADTLTMAPGAVLMIHDPAGATFGDVAAHEATIKALNALGDAYAGIYAERAGVSVEDARALMKSETWMTVDEAIAQGFADAPADPEIANDNDPAEPAPFAYGVYARAPERFVALANARGWKPRAMLAVAPAAQPAPQEIPTMSDAIAGGPPPADDPVLPVAEPDPAPPVAVPPADLAAVMATLAQAHFSAEQMTAFVAAGGDIITAQARLAEVNVIKADIARARQVNPTVTMSVEDAVARNLTAEQAMAEMWPQITAQIPIDPHPPVATDVSLMRAAAEAVNRENDRLRGIR